MPIASTDKTYSTSQTGKSLANTSTMMKAAATKPSWPPSRKSMSSDQSLNHMNVFKSNRASNTPKSGQRTYGSTLVFVKLDYGPAAMNTVSNPLPFQTSTRILTLPGLHMLQKANIPFSKAPSLYAPQTLPTLQDWQSLWSTWDIVTKHMLPKQELTEKPIKLRNACIFYLGHIPTFLDIQLTKTTKMPPTDPASYYAIFERGIDPDVDNPEQCHVHSEIPDEWPSVEEITAYQGRVRDRLGKLYKGGVENLPRQVARAIWVGFEHELMHIETLLYMMLQSDRTLPPPHMGIPDFERMAKRAFEGRVENEWFEVPAQEISIGMNDPEDGADDVDFGW